MQKIILLLLLSFSLTTWAQQFPHTEMQAMIAKHSIKKIVQYKLDTVLYQPTKELVSTSFLDKNGKTIYTKNNNRVTKNKYNEKGDYIEIKYLNGDESETTGIIKYLIEYESPTLKKTTVFHLDGRITKDKRYYDEKGNEIKTEMFNEKDSLTGYFLGTYDGNGNRILSESYDGLGQLTNSKRIKYNENNLPTIEYGEKHNIYTTYNKNNKPVLVESRYIDSSEYFRQRQFIYENDLLIEATYHQVNTNYKSSTSFEYDDSGLLFRSKSKHPKQVAQFIYEYDEKKQLKKRTYLNHRGEGQNIIDYFYNKKGQKIKSVKLKYGKERPTTFEYDKKGNLIRENFSEDIYKKYKYDKRGNLILTIEHSALYGAHIEEEVKYTYNNKNQLIEEIRHNYEGRIQKHFQYIYDKNGLLMERITLWKDGSVSKRDVYQYNPQGEKIKHTVFNQKNEIATSKGWKHNYNENGLLVSTTSINRKQEPGQEKIFIYNSDNLLIKEYIGKPYQWNITEYKYEFH